jgi:hypothetical protein
MFSFEEDKKNKKEAELNAIYKIFDISILFVEAEGGDGSGAIISDNYIELANLFEEYNEKRNVKFNLFLYRDDRGNYISFSNAEEGQESIVFSNDRNLLSDPFFEFVVKVDIKYQ